MDEFFNFIKPKKIHIIGITGAEGSSILRLLAKQSGMDITGHDFLGDDSIEKSFKLYHKGLTLAKRNKLYDQFRIDTSTIKTFYKDHYMESIDEADILFAPQSWRLYPRQNQKLFDLAKRGIPFYSLTRLYLDYAKAKVIAVTGTVGKGSVANLISECLRLSDKKVYFAGNETWRLQVADLLPQMKEDEFLVIEISHRQLLDGFSRAPAVAVFTNLYPNHLDEVSWKQYQALKWSLFQKQKNEDYSVINYDNENLRKKTNNLKSNIIYYSSKSNNMNTKNVQKLFSKLMNTKSSQFSQNILASLTVMDLLNLDITQFVPSITHFPPLPARCQLIKTIHGIAVYNDIKSTTPWATLEAIKQLKKKVILICGGETKGIDYTSFAQSISKTTKKVIILKSGLSDVLVNYITTGDYHVVNSLEMAISFALKEATSGEAIVISPAAAFFYSKFIRGKNSITKVITSLLPVEQSGKGLD